VTDLVSHDGSIAEDFLKQPGFEQQNKTSNKSFWSFVHFSLFLRAGWTVDAESGGSHFSYYYDNYLLLIIFILY